MMRTTRVGRDWTQLDVARALGYKSSSTISDWESSDTDLKVGDAQRYLEVFGIDAAEMFQKAARLTLDSPESRSVAQSSDREAGSEDGFGRKSQSSEFYRHWKRFRRAFRELEDYLDE